MDIEILGCKLVCTCESCPEQYDVFMDEDKIGYLRLRHGWFRADYVHAGKNHLVFEAKTTGDGIFEHWERNYYLQQAVVLLLARHETETEPTE